MNCKISSSLAWWDKKRVLFNIITLVAAVVYLIMIKPKNFGLNEIFGALLYGLILNVFYCLGFLMELYDYSYLKSKLKLQNYRSVFFILGTVFSVLYTLLQIDIYYFGFVG